MYDIQYWVNKGHSMEESYQLVEKSKKENSCWNKEFWIVKKGYSEKDAIKKIKEIQTKNSKKQNKKDIKNIYLVNTWIDKGYSKKDAIEKIKILKEKCNIYKNLDKDILNDILKKRKETYYSKTIEERKKINKSRGRTKKQLIDKYGEEYVDELSINRGKGRRNNIFRRYSKISKSFFDDLKILVDDNLLYGENEKWIRYNKNKGYYVDLLIEDKNKIIEFNGDFYHANPKIYESNSTIKISKSKILIANEIWKQDKLKLNNLNELGYDVLIIWEQDVLENRDDIINECIKFIKK